MGSKGNKRFHKKIITSEHLALKQLRQELDMTLAQAGEKVGLSSKSIGVIENGRVNLDKNKIDRLVKAYGLTFKDFLKAKRLIDKEGFKKQRKRVAVRSVLSNLDRRSYQKIITKECRILKSMRRIKGLSQAKASLACGYPRATIGHIENGRIELNRARVEHIVASYDYDMKQFAKMMEEEVTKDEIVQECYEYLRAMKDEKLRLAYSLILNLIEG